MITQCSVRVTDFNDTDEVDQWINHENTGIKKNIHNVMYISPPIISQRFPHKASNNSVYRYQYGNSFTQYPFICIHSYLLYLDGNSYFYLPILKKNIADIPLNYNTELTPEINWSMAGNSWLWDGIFALLILWASNNHVLIFANKCYLGSGPYIQFIIIYMLYIIHFQ